MDRMKDPCHVELDGSPQMFAGVDAIELDGRLVRVDGQRIGDPVGVWRPGDPALYDAIFNAPIIGVIDDAQCRGCLFTMPPDHC